MLLVSVLPGERLGQWLGQLPSQDNYWAKTGLIWAGQLLSPKCNQDNYYKHCDSTLTNQALHEVRKPGVKVQYVDTHMALCMWLIMYIVTNKMCFETSVPELSEPVMHHTSRIMSSGKAFTPRVIFVSAPEGRDTVLASHMNVRPKKHARKQRGKSSHAPIT